MRQFRKFYFIQIPEVKIDWNDAPSVPMLVEFPRECVDIIYEDTLISEQEAYEFAYKEWRKRYEPEGRNRHNAINP